jgi:hypothetical protein
VTVSIFSRFFKPAGQRPQGVDVRGVQVIPTTCPLCGSVGDFIFDPNKHDFVWAFELDKKTHLHVLECPYCTAGMLLCIRDGRMLGIEGYKDDTPADLMAAVGRARSRWS